MRIGKKDFPIGRRTYIVGILNVTPDSFFDGGRHAGAGAALARAQEMLAGGADIIEVGGESTRPGHKKVDAATELARVLPVVEALAAMTDAPIAVDTSKAAVADAALAAGACMVNDISCFALDGELPGVCARRGAVCCAMHNRGNQEYRNLLMDVLMDLHRGIHRLERAGVPKGSIIIDPGIGFAKALPDNLAVLRNLSYFTSGEYPVMLGASRKSFMGRLFGLAPDQRLETTLATTALAVSQRVDFIRVHDVPENKRAAMMADELARGGH